MAVNTFVIINADDFGWTEGINEGIIEAHRHGVLTSATLVANAAATRHAVAQAAHFPNLSVGVHLSYQLGEPLLARDEVDTLYDSEGRPRFSLPALWLHATLRKKVRSQLDAHFRSQVEHVLNLGVPLTHLDTHKHVHFWPAVFDLVARIASDHGIPAVRLVREYPADPGPAAVKTRMAVLGLFWTSIVNRRTIAQYDLRCPDRFIGIIQTGRWTRQMFMDVVRSVRPGVTEIMTHPGHPEGLENEPTRLVESRRTELNILTYPLVKEHFHQCQKQMKLIGYRDIASLR